MYVTLNVRIWQSCVSNGNGIPEVIYMVEIEVLILEIW